MAHLLDIDEGRAAVLLEPIGGARLGVARVEAWTEGTVHGAVAWFLVEGGRYGKFRFEHRGRCVLEGPDLRRANVFDEPGQSFLVGPQVDFRFVGHLHITIVWCPSSAEPGTVRWIPPESVREEVRGEGPTRRIVRTYVDRGELIVGETINPPGGWSSYPPHRHPHEEMYLYRFERPEGFGVHVSYDESGDSARVVRDGSVERITGGYHPVVASPLCSMYYCWALAGEAESVDTQVDPRFTRD